MLDPVYVGPKPIQQSTDTIWQTGGPGIQVQPFRMLGGYRTTWLSLNDSLLGIPCDSMKWDSTHHSYFASISIHHGQDTTRVGLYTLTMKPNPFFAGWDDNRFQAAPVVSLNDSTVNIPGAEGVRSIWGPAKDTLFIFYGFYPALRWDALQVWGVDTLVILW